MFATHKHRRKFACCPNCDTLLKPEDNFCPNCGQENHDLKIPFWHLAYEFIESIFHFDIKLWTTLKAIFTSPGKITNDFVEGKRVRYVHPARFYVFVSFILFLLLSMSGDKISSDEEDAKNDFAEGFTTGMQESSEEKDLVQNNPIIIHSEDKEFGFFNGQVDSLSKEKFIYLYAKKDSIKLTESLARRIYFNEKSMDSLLQKTKIGEGNEGSMSKLIRMQIVFNLFNSVERRMVLKEYTHSIIKYTSYVMFVFMPIVAFLLLILYYFKRKFYYEHLIFSIHLHTILFLFLIIAMLLSKIPVVGDYVILVYFLVSIIYTIMSLRRVYKQNYFYTILKFMLISFVYLILFVLIIVFMVYYII